jgi:hypothetical protein
MLELYLRVVALAIFDPKTEVERHLRDIWLAIFETEMGKRLSGALFSTEVKNSLKTWSPSRLFFSQLEARFRQLLVELPEDREVDEDGDPEYGRNKLPEWRVVLRQVALETFQDITAGLGESPRVLKAAAQVEGRFRAALYKVTGNLS